MKNFYSKYRETLIIALQSLNTHKTRSLLTMLGIIFGVGAVISMLSIGDGARQESLEQIEVLGVRNIIIRSKKPDTNAGSDEQKKTRPMGLTQKDADAIGQICGFDERIATSWETEADARTYEGKIKAMLIGVTPDFASIFNIRPSAGAFLVPAHLSMYANVCVIGSDVRKELFGFTNPIGKLVKLNDHWFTVAGAIEERKASTLQGVDVPSSTPSCSSLSQQR